MVELLSLGVVVRYFGGWPLKCVAIPSSLRNWPEPDEDEDNKKGKGRVHSDFFLVFSFERNSDQIRTKSESCSAAEKATSITAIQSSQAAGEDRKD